MKQWMGHRLVWALAGVLVLGLAVLLLVDFTPNVGLCLPDEQAALTEALQEKGIEAKSVTDQTLQKPVALLVADSQMAENSRFAGTPAIYVDLQPETGCYIGGDAGQAGKLQAQMLLQQEARGDWNEDGVVTCYLLAPDLSSPDMNAWASAIKTVLREANLKLELVEAKPIRLSRDAGAEACGQVMAEYGKDLEVVFAYSDALTLGAMDAIADVGRTVDRSVTLIGCGRSGSLPEMVENSSLSGYAGLDEAAFLQAVKEEVIRAAWGGTPQSRILEYTAY